MVETCQTWNHTFKRNPADGARAMLQHGAAQVSRWCDLAILHLKIVPNYAKTWLSCAIISEKNPKHAKLVQFPSWIWRSSWNPGWNIHEHSNCFKSQLKILLFEALWCWGDWRPGLVVRRKMLDAGSLGACYLAPWTCAACDKSYHGTHLAALKGKRSEINGGASRSSAAESSHWTSGFADKRSKLLAAQCQNVSKLHCTNSSSSLSCGRRTDRTKDALSEEAKVNLSTLRAGLSRDCIHDVICVFLPRPAVENLCLEQLWAQHPCIFLCCISVHPCVYLSKAPATSACTCWNSATSSTLQFHCLQFPPRSSTSVSACRSPICGPE